MSLAPVWLGGAWTPSLGTTSFQAANPRTREPLTTSYPISPWAEIDTALETASKIAAAVRNWPGERFADFLDRYAQEIEQRAEALIELAHQETALPVTPRLKDVELPRTIGQLRQAAQAARSRSWQQPIIDTKSGIRSCLEPLGPVAVFGPNNFPFAFNSIAGGDFAAAVAAGNPVIAKAHSAHPGTTRLFAEAADAAAQATGMPAGFVQLIYRTSHADGERLVSDPRLGATGYTGSRSAGLKLKAAADLAGKPIYLELSSVNPVVILPGALAERSEALVTDYAGSCLAGTGQFCTNPGLVLLLAGVATEAWITSIVSKFSAAPVGTLLGEAVLSSLSAGVKTLHAAGAEILCGGAPGGGTGVSYQNTVLKVSGSRFLTHAHQLQTEAFGNAALFVVCETATELLAAIGQLEGNLTGSIYSSTTGDDDALADQVACVLRPKVGRLLNDKMPTGVAVVASMNHGGPYPATGHPGFTAVGLPTAISRFAQLACYDNVRPQRLPVVLQNAAPVPPCWRLVDGRWTEDAVG